MNWLGRTLLLLTTYSASYAWCDTTIITTREKLTTRLHGVVVCEFSNKYHRLSRNCMVELFTNAHSNYLGVTGYFTCGMGKPYASFLQNARLGLQCQIPDGDTNDTITITYDVTVSSEWEEKGTPLYIRAWYPSMTYYPITVSGTVNIWDRARNFSYTMNGSDNSLRYHVTNVGTEEWIKPSIQDRTIRLEYPGMIKLKPGEKQSLLRTSSPVSVSIDSDLQYIDIQTNDGATVPLNTETNVQNELVIAEKGSPLGITEGKVVLNVSAL